MELQSDKNEFLSALLGEKFSAEEMGRIEKMKQNRLALTENGFAVLESAAMALIAERERMQASVSGDKFSALRAKQEKLKQMKTQK